MRVPTVSEDTLGREQRLEVDRHRRRASRGLLQVSAQKPCEDDGDTDFESAF